MLAPLTLTVGVVFTVTVVVFVFVQPGFPVDPVSVYVMVAVGLAAGAAQVVHDNAVLGDQV
jgi:hypothetical protein